LKNKGITPKFRSKKRKKEKKKKKRKKELDWNLRQM